MNPLSVSCRVGLASLALWLCAAGTAHAVIPGIAPGLAAILPQLLLLLVGTFTLLLSPRTWWSIVKAAVRRPLRSTALLLGAATVAYGAARLPSFRRGAEPGAPPAELIEGFEFGDLHAARCRSMGEGPLAQAEVMAGLHLEETLAGPVETLVPAGERAVLVHGGGKEIAALNLLRGDVAWRLRLDAPVAAGPIGVGRRVDGGSQSVIAVVTGEVSGVGTGTLHVLAGEDGTPLGRAPLPSAPTPHACVAGDRALAVLGGSIICFALSGPDAPRKCWEEARPARRPRGFAGGADGEFFLLDEEALLCGETTGGPLRRVAAFAPGAPARLAVRDGRAYVLTVSPRGARVHCIDPAPAAAESGEDGSVVWTADVERPVDDEITAAAFGVAVASANELRILDPLTGAVGSRLSLESAPACAAAAGDLSCYLLLAGGRVLRFSPGLGSTVWSLDLPAPAAARAGGGPAATALVVAGERIVASLDGAPRVLRERRGLESLPWSQWRGGPSRAGSCDGDGLPLAARVLWRRPLVPRAAGESAGEGEAQGMWVLPLAEGWLAGASAGFRSRAAWLSGDGSLLGEVLIAGRSVGAVRLEDRLFCAAVSPSGGGLIVCVGAERAGGRTSLRERWTVDTPPLAAGLPLAATGDLLVVGLESSLLALAAASGAPSWEHRGVSRLQAPLAAGGVVLAAGEAPEGDGVILALGAHDGRVHWQRRERGRRWGPPSLSGGLLLVPSRDGEGGGILVLRPEDGSTVREVALEGDSPLGPLAAADGAACCAGRSGSFHFGRFDEGAAWRRVAAAGDAGLPPLLPPILALDLAVMSSGSLLRCIDTGTREEVWEVELPAPPLDAALQGGRILVAVPGELFLIGAP